MKKALAACFLSTIAGTSLGQEPAKTDVSAPSIVGSWTRDDNKALLIQHFQDKRFFAARIDPKSKVMFRHSCGDFTFGKEPFPDGWHSFAIATKFATKQWEHFIGESPRDYPTKFDGETMIRRMSSRVPFELETWKQKVPLVGSSSIDGIWQQDGGLRLYTIKAFMGGRVYTTLVDTGTSKIKGGSIGTYKTGPQTIVETVEFATEEWKEMIGKSTTSKVTVDNGSLIFEDKRGKTEKWDSLPTK